MTNNLEGELWSLIRRVLTQGHAQQMDYAAGKYVEGGYEAFSANTDHAARERVGQFLALLNNGSNVGDERGTTPSVSGERGRRSESSGAEALADALRPLRYRCVDTPEGAEFRAHPDGAYLLYEEVIAVWQAARRSAPAPAAPSKVGEPVARVRGNDPDRKQGHVDWLAEPLPKDSLLYARDAISALREGAQDAARYRWLRSQRRGAVQLHRPDGSTEYRPLDGSLDAAIDDALKEPSNGR